MNTRTTILLAALMSTASLAGAQTVCPSGTQSCTISTQDAGHNTVENTKSNATQIGNSATTNGNTISPSFDNSAQTTQNATTRTGDVSSDSRGNTTSANNQSSASNGQSNTGTVGNISVGGSSASNGPISLGGASTGASTSTGGTVGNVGSASTSAVGDVGSTSSTGASTSGATGGTVGNVGASTGASTSGSSASTGASTGGTSSASTGAATSGGNRIDASTRSTSKAIFIPPVVPGTPPSFVGIGNIVQQVSACGPRQVLARTAVKGAYMGLFKTTQIDQGSTDDLVDAPALYLDVPLEDGRDGFTRFGHQVFMSTTVIGLGGARNLALGGGGGNGSWGQGGAGASSSTQRVVTSIQLRTCEIGTYVVPSAPAMDSINDGERG